MATYAELITASNNDALNAKIGVACFIAAEKVRTEAATVPNHVNRLKWAKRVFESGVSPVSMMWAVLAQNSGATLAAITGSTDAQVQTAVDAAVDVFATGA